MIATDDAARRKAAELAHGQAIAVAGISARVWQQHSAAGRARVQRRAELIRAAAALAPGMRCLELGCGTGEYTALLGDAGAHLVALDISDDLLRVAAARGLPAHVLLVRGDAERLPFPDRAFDAVTGNAVLHHLRLAPALAELRRVLHPGGIAAFTEPNMLNPQVAVTKNVPAVKRWLGDTPHETAFIAGRLRRALGAARLAPVQVTAFDFLHPAVPAAAISAVRRIERIVERLPLVSAIAGSLLVVARRPADAD